VLGRLRNISFINVVRVCFVIKMFVLSLIFITYSTEESNAGEPSADLKTYRSKVQPILKKLCYDCHGLKKAKADLRLDQLDPDLLRGKDPEMWREILDIINVEEMPPKKATQFETQERRTVIDWLTLELKKASKAINGGFGKQTSFRRLTKYEFVNTLVDLLDITLSVANVKDDLPDEISSPEGFKNNSKLLFLSPDHITSYKEIALKALKIAAPKQTDMPQKYWYSTDVRYPDQIKGPRFNSLNLEKQTTQPKLPSTDVKGVTMPLGTIEGRPSSFKFPIGRDLPDYGKIRIRIRASKGNASTRPARMLIAFENPIQKRKHDPIAEIDVTAPPNNPEIYEIEVDLSQIGLLIGRNVYRKLAREESSKLRLKSFEIITVSNITFPLSKQRNNVKSKKGKGKGKTVEKSGGEKEKSGNSSLMPSLIVDYVEVVGPIYDQWPPQSYKNIFISSENKGDESVYAKEIIANFMSKAYRRPVEAGEVDKMFSYYKEAREIQKDFHESVVEALSVVLACPDFLYLVEDKMAVSNGNSLLSSYELASRLSYFLWCGPPDEKLLELAKTGKLTDVSKLSSEVDRMLNDPKSQRFSEQFSYQWLGLNLLDILCVDKKVHGAFDAKLESSMAKEPVAFFNQVLKENLSVMNFIESDFVMVDERLAKHYGIDGVVGNDLHKVKISPQHHRGGILTQAAFLAACSNGVDSHPIKRGIWLLERVLDDPPPPPPAAVSFDEEDPSLIGLTLKQKMEVHRKKEACIDCHMKIDPWGIALESYSAIGGWRTRISRKDIKSVKIDSSVKLSDGNQIDGIDSLKKYLLTEKKEKFAKAIVNKVCTFALGRSLHFSDREEIDQIFSSFKKVEYKLSDLIKIVVLSKLFRSK